MAVTHSSYTGKAEPQEDWNVWAEREFSPSHISYVRFAVDIQ